VEDEGEGLTTEAILKERPGWELFRDGCPGGEMPDQVGARADRVAYLKALVRQQRLKARQIRALDHRARQVVAKAQTVQSQTAPAAIKRSAAGRPEARSSSVMSN